MRVAIIPARGGSKRIPHKNIRLFNGKPIIAYSIEVALASGCFDSVIVSTDDLAIADVALRYGAKIPFMRPAAIADDYATTLDVMQHAIEWLNTHDEPVTEACCIYANAPFLQVETLQKGKMAICEKDFDYAFTATDFGFPIQRALHLKSKGVAFFYPEYINTRSQDLTPAYHDAGQCYWGRAQAFLSGLPILGETSCPLLLPRYSVQDIDTLDDWYRAELLYQLLLQSKGV
jgi:N-acylneuraminate cytidylyltransferase